MLPGHGRISGEGNDSGRFGFHGQGKPATVHGGLIGGPYDIHRLEGFPAARFVRVAAEESFQKMSLRGAVAVEVDVLLGGEIDGNRLRPAVEADPLEMTIAADP